MKATEPIRKDNGKTYCGNCGAQIVFYWAKKPGFCAMCGCPIGWTPDMNVINRLRVSVENAENTNDRLAKVTTPDAREILDMLEFYMEISGEGKADDTACPVSVPDSGDNNCSADH